MRLSYSQNEGIAGLTCSDHFGMNRLWDFFIRRWFYENIFSIPMTWEFYQVFGVGAWSPESEIGVCLRVREWSDCWFDMFRPFWDESSLGFFDQEMILRKHFFTSDVVLPMRPNIYSQLLKSWRNLVSDPGSRKHRLVSHAQGSSQMVFICRIESLRAE